MKKINSLILLIHSLSKSEKKSIYLQSDLTKGEKAYMYLFDLIDKGKIEDSNLLLVEYMKKYAKSSFHAEVRYLYNFILGVLSKIKIAQDPNYGIYSKLANAKVLKERNLDFDHYTMLLQLEKEAKEIGNYYLLLLIRRMKLDTLQQNNFKDISENTLLKEQYTVTETIKIIRQINEQSSLYELLMHRIEKTPLSKYESQKKYFNDIVVSEISLVSNLRKDVFEIQKLHQLFQASYLNFVGDNKSALNAFVELDNLFDKNRAYWDHSPLYYASVLEGVLASLKSNQQYEQMSYFLDKLRSFKHPSIPFQTEVACIRFIYRTGAYIDNDNYKEAYNLIDDYKESLMQRIDLLTPYRYLQLSLHLAIVYLLNNRLSHARKQLARIVGNDSYAVFWPFRPIQLVNLGIYYELGDYDFIGSQIRSIKRENKLTNKSSKLENIIFYFLGIDLLSLSNTKKDRLLQKIESEFDIIRNDNENKRILDVFDFEKWMVRCVG